MCEMMFHIFLRRTELQQPFWNNFKCRDELKEELRRIDGMDISRNEFVKRIKALNLKKMSPNRLRSLHNYLENCKIINIKK